MNAKTIFLICALTIGTASSSFGMETSAVLPKRSISTPILDSQKSTPIADETAKALSTLAQLHNTTPKESRSCLGTCCKILKIIAEILKETADERAIN